VGTDGERTGFELLDLLTDLGVCSKQRVLGGPQDRGGWVGKGWSANELAAASQKIRRPVSAMTWNRFVRRPHPGQKPYTGNGKKLADMAATLRYLHDIACTGVVVSDDEIMLAWAAAKGVPVPPVHSSGLNVVKFGESPTDVLVGLVEAAGSPDAGVEMLVAAATALGGGYQSKLLARLAVQLATESAGRENKGR
jgi:hypothetical protein